VCIYYPHDLFACTFRVLDVIDFVLPIISLNDISGYLERSIPIELTCSSGLIFQDPLLYFDDFAPELFKQGRRAFWRYIRSISQKRRITVAAVEDAKSLTTITSFTI